MDFKAFFALLMILVNVNFGHAQNTLSGTIKDKETYEPLVNATIFIENTKTGTVSDSQGNFELINLPEGYSKILVTHVGDKFYSANTQSKKRIHISLKPDILKLEEVVVYRKEKAEAGYINDKSSNLTMQYNGPDKKMVWNGIEISNESETRFQVSYLFNRASKIEMNKYGQLKNPEYLLEYGYWSWERITELMPIEYHMSFINKNGANAKINKSDQVMKDSIPEKNGFRLSKLLIPVNEIVGGGVKKDGIPAIDNPKFSSVEETDWLNKKDMVLGIEFNGEHRAYPIRILDRHEAVNDEINGKSVLITYCPLCGSGMAFNPNINGEKRTFGISGLLFNSDVLLYDRETMSLWSQIESKAISGSMSGALLTHLPTYHLTWGEWKDKFPKSKVLTRETGFNRNYDTEAYQEYRRSSQLMFSVKDQNPNLATKEMVIGISINGKHKAYTLRKLKKNKAPLEDRLGGKKIIISYFPKSNSAIVTDSQGNMLPSTRLYWFAWYAFHTDTELY